MYWQVYFRSYQSCYIEVKQGNIIIHPNINSGLIKSPLKLWHIYFFTTNKKTIGVITNPYPNLSYCMLAKEGPFGNISMRDGNVIDKLQ